MTTARDLMTAPAVTLSVRARVRDAVRTLATLDIRHLPVVSDEGELVGMLSDRDVKTIPLPYDDDEDDTGSEDAWLDGGVVHVMNLGVVSSPPEADASEVVDLMLKHRIGAVPVVDNDGSVVGIVSYVDVLRRISFDGPGQ